MEPLAQALNDRITAANPHVYAMLSDLGKRIYFPSKGILSQSGEAKKLAKTYNATIGTAMEGGKAMHLPCLMQQLPGISPNDALLYAPSPGLQALREAWRDKMLRDNPGLQGTTFSLPIVTTGLSHGLSLAADLLVDAGDRVLMADMNWDNYHLNFVVRKGAETCLFPFFKDDGFDVEAFADALQKYSVGRDKLVVLLNFPNNPSGYTVTEAEGEAIAAALLATAERGVNLVVIIDDAYCGLFFDDDVMRQSLFVKLGGHHPRLLAVRADAATKEVFVWGLRVGFVSMAVGGGTDDMYAALNEKLAGLIRSVVSNASALSQKLVLDALRSPSFIAEHAAKVEVMKARALRVREVLRNPAYAEAWTAYPFNSGYFMCLRINQINTETLRRHLLEKYGVGTISITATDLRIAFSCLEVEQIQDLFDIILKAWKDLAK